MDDLTKKTENEEIEEEARFVTEKPMILEEVEVEQISVDGICGVY